MYGLESAVLVCGLGKLLLPDCDRRDETNDETRDSGGGGGGTVLRSPGQCHLGLSRGGWTGEDRQPSNISPGYNWLVVLGGLGPCVV